MGRNAEAYVDDIVVKSCEGDNLLRDLEETFASLCKVNIKLNPAKCVFGVPSGKLLGFLVSHLGIEANPNKIKAIEAMQPPRRPKDMRVLPFFKIMKKTSTFKQTPEADKAFKELKRYLASAPVMVAPRRAST